MKKLTLILLLAVAALGLLPATVAMATPVDELTTLAAYFPADTAAFAGLRVDDEYIATLDDLIADLNGKLPDEMMAPFSFQSQLNDLASQVSGGEGDFDTEVRSWLGDTAAVGLLDLDFEDDVPHYLIALSVTDAIPAEELIGTITDFTDFGQAEEGEDYILWEAAGGMSGGGSVLLADDVLLIAQDTETVMAAHELNGDGTLAQNDEFASSLALLPESEYNIVAYLANPLELFTALSQRGQLRLGVFNNNGDMDHMELPSEITEAVGPQVWGFTILDDRTLTLDIAQVAGEMSGLEELGFTLPAITPISPDFAAHIPADAPFVVQGSGLGPAILNGLETLDHISAMMEDMADGEMPRPRIPGLGALASHSADFRSGVFFRQAVEGMTGLDLEDDILGWMTGDYALYARILPAEGINYTFDTALLIAATDSDSASGLVTAIQGVLEQFESEFSTEEIGGGNALLLPDAIRGWFPRETSDDMLIAPELDFLIGANSDVFAVGSRPGVEFALAPEGDSLADNAVYAAASEYILPGAQNVLFVNPEPLRSILEVAAQHATEDDEDEGLAKIQAIIDLCESLTISSAYSDNYDSVTRITVTLAE